MSGLRQDEPSHVREQYRDSSNLDARSALHLRFSTNDYGWFRWIFDRLDLGPQARVLDVGCGPGGLWRDRRAAVPLGWRVTLADQSPGMVFTAREALDDDRFAMLAADAQALPFGDGTFDAVVANHMLYHVPDIDAAVAEFARVLAPGGRLVAATNGQRHMMQMRELLSEDGLSVSGFDLEGGADILARSFPEVTLDRYEDSLAVTDPEPVLAYVRSMHTLWVEGHANEDAIRRTIADGIERDGVFTIEKDAGAFVAVRP